MFPEKPIVIKGNESQTYRMIPIGNSTQKAEVPVRTRAQKALANYHARGELVRTWAVFDMKSEGGLGFNMFGDLLIHFPDDSVLIMTYGGELRLGSQMSLEMCVARYANSPIY
jgi:hypothetical protein